VSQLDLQGTGMRLTVGELMLFDLEADGAPLLEREAELGGIRAALSAAREGRGSVTLVEGHAGTGKTRLLREARVAAQLDRMPVLLARGDEAEREFAFGVVLGLLETSVQRAEPGERERVLAGAARLAQPLFDGSTAAAPALGPQALFSFVHGLYWIIHNLAERGPLLLLVDDAQWADIPSLRFLAYLSRRVLDLPVAVMVASRVGEEPVEPAPLRELGARPFARRLALGPLSAAAVAALVRARLGAASDGFCEACSEATAGNPFLVDELLRTVAAEELAATDDDAAQIRALAPEAVSRSILLRLSSLPPAATALARAFAVLGEAPLAVAARLARLDADAGAGLAGALVASGILTDNDPVSFSHPIVRAAVRADTPHAGRGRLELRAAELLRSGGAPPDRVSAHLLAAPPAHEPWVLEPLRLAAAHAMATGAPESAVRYLRRALAEPPPSDIAADVLVELGQAEAVAADPEAPNRFKAALELLDDSGRRSRVELMLGRALSAQGRHLEAADAFERGASGARGRDSGLVAELEAGYLSAAKLEPALYPVAAERIERLVGQPPHEDTPGQRPLLAELALVQGIGGAPVGDVLPLAERAWADGALLAEQGPDSQSIYALTGALISIDELELDLAVLGAALREAQRRGSVMAVATASYCRTGPLYLLARIPEALADIEHAVGSEQDGWEMFLPSARAFWALALLERGELGAAERALELRETERWVGTLNYVVYLDARARVRLAQRRPREALADALESGRLLEDNYGGMRARGICWWRCSAALAASAIGEPDRARRLCEEELEIAHAGALARDIGMTQVTAAMVERGERRIELLAEAVATLEHAQSVLELLRALVELGGALRRAGRRRDARGPLERALDVASSRGATALAQRAREELLTTGARPRRTALRGIAALTPSELRVARLAGEGLMNREIAEALFVSRKTVDYHLRHIYQKLDIGRDGLASALAAPAKD
jgi:DNA-binding CsgD family transcriptional regulator